MLQKMSWAGAASTATGPEGDLAWRLDLPNRYNVEVSEASEGRFFARCRETLTEIISTNAEYDIAHALTVAGFSDGRVQFWRGSTPSLSHPSIHRMGRYRITLGEEFPARVKRKASPEIATDRPAGSVRNRETAGLRP
jgi:hypothetical protein